MKKIKFQEVAVESLLKYTINNYEEEKLDVTFSSPVGSGKTMMIGKYMNDLPQRLKAMGIENNISFIWISPGKGKLDEQSKNKIKKLSTNINCILLKDLLVNQELRVNDAVFTDWEKIQSDNNIAWRDGDFNGLNYILSNRNCKIILLIDEAHDTSNTELSQNIIDRINPFMTIYITATPKDIKGKHINIDIDDVIAEELIKSSVVINPNLKINKSESFIDILIKETIKKREELEKLYLENESSVIPLCLIQIENDNSETKDNSNSIDNCNRIKEKLLSNGITEDKIAIWLASEKTTNLKDISENDVEYLIFKQAVATGWDCPRAQILIRLRETKSIIFDIQTIGRIMRMPELHFYPSDELNKAYIYTDDDNFEYNVTVDDKMKSKIRSDKNEVSIKTKYISDKMNFTLTSEKVAVQYSAYIDGETLYELLLKRLTPELKKLEQNIKLTREIINGDVETTKFYTEKFELESNKNIEISEKDISDRFNYYIRKIYPKFNLSSYLYSISERNNINRKLFRKIFLFYREQLSLIIKEAIEFFETSYLRFNTTRTYVLPEKSYFLKYVDNETNNNYLYDKTPDFKYLFDKKIISEPEYKFSQYLLKNSKIKFWLKNGDVGNEFFSILYKIKSEETKIVETLPFYPDYIAVTNDNKLLILETKGFSDIDKKTDNKYNAIKPYLNKHKKSLSSYKEVIFSIVRYIDENPYVLINTEKYIKNMSDSEHWVKLDEVI